MWKVEKLEGNRWMVKNILSAIAIAICTDEAAAEAICKTLNSIQKTTRARAKND